MDKIPFFIDRHCLRLGAANYEKKELLHSAFVFSLFMRLAASGLRIPRWHPRKVLHQSLRTLEELSKTTRKVHQTKCLSLLFFLFTLTFETKGSRRAGPFSSLYSFHFSAPRGSYTTFEEKSVATRLATMLTAGTGI